MCVKSSGVGRWQFKIRMRKVMSCFYTEAELQQREINDKINRILRKQKHEERSAIKLLLLGTGEAGKSTFIKQMRIIHGEGFSEADRFKFRRTVFQNVVVALQTMCNAMETLNLEFESQDANEAKSVIASINAIAIDELSDRLTAAIHSLWSDPSLQKCYEMRTRYQLSDSVEYFLANLARLACKDYIPTEQDILRARTPTTGVVEYSFHYKNKILFRFVDVAGQRCERRKWIHCFEEVTSIIFLVALSEYDQTLRESASENRMVESKALFKTIAESKWFLNSSVILFLNKTDLLEEKIQTSDLADHFPEFDGPKKDAEAAKKFIEDMFLRQLRPSRAEQVYPFYTCATDTDNITKVFKSVKDTVLIENLKSLQLYSYD